MDREAGARADESALIRISDLPFPQMPDRDLALVLIRREGNRARRCPLWAQSVRELAALVQGRDPSGQVFVNRFGRPITQFGVHPLVERCGARAVRGMHSLTINRVSPHTIPHTTASHLLRSGVDINTIRAWLGHVSLTSKNVYAEADLEMKAQALAGCEVGDPVSGKPWPEDAGLIGFLRNLERPDSRGDVTSPLRFRCFPAFPDPG